MSEKTSRTILAEARKCRGLDAVITARTTSTDEWAEYPDWMRFTLTDAMIDELLKLRALCKTNKLEDVSTYSFCDVGSASSSSLSDERERCSTDLDRLRVYDGGFFVLEANIKNTDVHFETVPLFFDRFFEEVINGRRFIALDGCDDDEDSEFQELVAEDEAEMQKAASAEAA